MWVLPDYSEDLSFQMSFLHWLSRTPTEELQKDLGSPIHVYLWLMAPGRNWGKTLYNGLGGPWAPGHFWIAPGFVSLQAGLTPWHSDLGHDSSAQRDERKSTFMFWPAFLGFLCSNPITAIRWPQGTWIYVTGVPPRTWIQQLTPFLGRISHLKNQWSMLLLWVLVCFGMMKNIHNIQFIILTILSVPFSH